jgi:hypothetical protein
MPTADDPLAIVAIYSKHKQRRTIPQRLDLAKVAKYTGPKQVEYSFRELESWPKRN